MTFLPYFKIEIMRKLLMFTLLLIGFTSCESLDYKGQPQLVVYVQDSPAKDYEALFISIASVELFTGVAWIEVPCYTNRFDLLSYNGSKMLNIVKSTILEGHYSKIRIRFNNVNNQLVIGSKNNPLRLNTEDEYVEFDYEFDAKNNEQTVLVYDIDPVKSVFLNGNNEYQFIPFVTPINLATWGVLNGVVVDKDEKPIKSRFLVEAVRSDGVVYNTFTINTGAFMFRLPEGVYNVTIFGATGSGYIDAVVNDVKIEIASATSIGGVKLLK